jgi:hypothetical protein
VLGVWGRIHLVQVLVLQWVVGVRSSQEGRVLGQMLRAMWIPSKSMLVA